MSMSALNVYIKFRSAKDFEIIPIDDHFVSVANLKQSIIQSKKLWWRDHLILVHAQTGEELDEDTLIPKHTSVIVHRLCRPEWARVPFVVDMRKLRGAENEQAANNGLCTAEFTTTQWMDEIDWYDFGDDVFAIRKPLRAESDNNVQNTPAYDKADEYSSLKGSIDSSDCKMQTHEGSGSGMSGIMIGGCGFERGGLELRKPSRGYICFRCNVPGHLIQHCPTNGDPNYDIKRKHPSTSVSLSNPYEIAFDREMQGLSSARSIGELPLELYCPLCKEVMKDAMMTIKCCFNSFCSTCIRNHLISKSTCVCGATSILADDIVPNKTIRDTINNMLKSKNGSTQNSGSALETQESAQSDQPKISDTPLQSLEKGKSATGTDFSVVTSEKELESLKKDGSGTGSDISEVTLASVCGEEPKLQVDVGEEMQQKLKLRGPFDYWMDGYMAPYTAASFGHERFGREAESVRDAKKRKGTGMMQHESSDGYDQRHFKRR